MVVEHFKKLLAQPGNIQPADISNLKSILEKYPYFQPARALYLKGLQNQGSFRYNYELKQTAAYTTDRKILFDFITSKNFAKKEDIHDKIIQKIEDNQPAEKATEKTTVEAAKEALEIGKPINFSKNERHSFNQWLQLSVHKPIIRESKKQEKPIEKKLQIIDKFLKTNPKITPVQKTEEVKIEVPKLKANKSLMTQTLAKVYLEQKKYEKAIKAYEILSLKYPEKSGFFADQIRKIKILQKDKS